MKYPNFIKEIRVKKHISQTDLAKKIGIDRSSLAHIEAGARKIPKECIELLCLILNVSVHDLFGSSEEERIDEVILKDSIEIINSVIDASDLTENQRINLLKHTYKMVKDVLEKDLTDDELEEEVNNLKKEIDKEAFKIQERKKNIFNFLKKPS